MKNQLGIPRAPIMSLEHEPKSRWEKISHVAYTLIHEHDDIVQTELKIGTPEQFRATAVDLDMRAAQLAEAKNIENGGAHTTNRDTYQSAQIFNVTTKEFQSELAKKRVLDIGCGEGVLADELKRKTKARMTLIDCDTGVIKLIPRTSGSRAVTKADRLPFSDESFDRTLSLFSFLPWSVGPVDKTAALFEALRVTKVGGSFLGTPLFTNLDTRHKLTPSDMALREIGDDQIDKVDPRAMKIWDIEDHVLLHTLDDLQARGLCAVTWSARIAIGASTNAKMELYSGIVDLLEPITDDVVTENMLYAQSFVPPAQP